MVLIAPSILSADFGHLHNQITEVDQAGADWIHIDVMDGRFVPNITMGPIVVQAARRATQKPLDVHLMIVEPERYIEAFAEAGADYIVVHAEATTHLQRTLAAIRHLGKKAGVALNPSTPESALEYVLQDIDQVLVMTVNPGFAHQQFLPACVEKIVRVRHMLNTAGNESCLIAVDGGLSPDTAGIVVQAGADVLIAGSAIYGSKDYRKAIEDLRNAF